MLRLQQKTTELGYRMQVSVCILQHAPTSVRPQVQFQPHERRNKKTIKDSCESRQWKNRTVRMILSFSQSFILTEFKWQNVILKQYLIQNMIEEQLLEVNSKIKQIECIINKRKEKVNDWNPPLEKIVQQKSDKSYLTKGFQRVAFKTLTKEQYESIKEQLSKKVKKSRSKIRSFFNQMKQLDTLTKKKNKIYLLAAKKKQAELEQKSFQENEKKIRTNNEIQKTDQASKPMFRTLKDRANPFLQTKADKFVQIAMIAKKNDENLESKLAKHFKVGLQNTPFGISLKKEEKRQENFTRSESKKFLKTATSKSNFGKSFNETFDQKQKIFGMAYKPRNIFQDRIKKIIKYHGDFWREEFELN